MLKNWIVKHQQKKSSYGHIHYLENENAKSHDGTRIVVLRNNSKTICEAKEKRSEFRKENGLRGGGVKNELSSFILAIPTDVTQLDDKQWKTLSDHVLKNLHADINKKIIKQNEKFKNNKKQSAIKEISLSDFIKHSHVVLHDEKHKNSHIHVIVSNVINNDFIKPITQLGASYSVKNSFNFAMKKLVNEDHMDYVPGNSVFAENDIDFTEKREVGDRPKNHQFASRFKAILDNLQDSFNGWLKAVFNDDTLEIKGLAEETAKNINLLGNTKRSDVDIILDTAKTIEKANDLPDSLKITNKVKHNRKRRRRPKKVIDSPDSKSLKLT